MAPGSRNRTAVLATALTFMVLPRFDFNVKIGNSKAALDGLSNPVAECPIVFSQPTSFGQMTACGLETGAKASIAAPVSKLQTPLTRISSLVENAQHVADE